MLDLINCIDNQVNIILHNKNIKFVEDYTGDIQREATAQVSRISYYCSYLKAHAKALEAKA